MNKSEMSSGFITPQEESVSREFVEQTVVASEGYNELVRAQRFGRWWLLKGLKSEYRTQTVYRTLLRKEFDLLTAMQHQGIVSVADWTRVEGLGECIVMEWIDGETLDKWLEKKPALSLRRRVAQQLTAALEYVHGRQVVHRDLKPANIMITRSGNNVKLIDFGLSDSDDYAILKQPAGTKGYLSPEQERQYQTDVRNDIYSLGQVLSDLRLGLLSRPVVRRCMAPSDRRYAHVKDVERALHAWRQWPKRIAVAVMILALVILTPLAYRAGQQKIAATADSLTATMAEHQLSTQEKQSLLERQNDSLRGRITELETRENAVKAREDLLKALTDKGKKEIDRLAVSTGLATYYDTLSACHSPMDDPFDLNQANSVFYFYPEKYVNNLPDSLSSDERAAILNGINSYVEEKYSTPWYKKQMESGRNR